MAQDLKTHAVFVRRVLAQLVRTNIVEAREGRDGGYRLARSTEEITLADVYKAVKVAEPQDDASYHDGVNAHIQTILNEVGDEAEQHLIDALKQHTLASVLERMTTL
jgi:Rrf2 family protein